MNSISLVSATSRVSFQVLQHIARSCAAQIQKDAAPAWSKTPWGVVAAPSVAMAPHGSYVLLVVGSDASTPDAEAWHTEEGDGKIVLQAMADPILDNGGTLLTGPDSVAAAISHEVIETFIDPNVSMWFQGADGRLIAGEACDPCQDESYLVLGVSMSDFVKPAYFDPQTSSHDLSHNGKIAAPFGRTPGGYQAIMEAGAVTQEFGERVPEWKRAWKSKSARMVRRSA